MMTHLEDLISAYIDDEISDQDRLMVEEHLENCPQCCELMESLTTVRGLVSTAYRSVEAPGLLEQKVLAAIGRDKTAPSPAYAITLPWGVAMAAILLMFIFFSQSPIVIFGFGVVSSLMHILVRLLHVLTVFIITVPYLLAEIAVFAIILSLVSGWSLRRLLISKG